MKVCSHCNKSKTLAEFVKSTLTKSGRGSHCLVCDRMRVALRRSDPGVKTRTRTYILKYRASNGALLRERDRNRARANCHRIRTQARKIQEVA
jgi:hypothetical protein